VSVKGPQVADLLRSCERSASHLEMRDAYSRSDPMFTAWRSGFRHDPGDRASWWRPWLDVVAEALSRGVRVRRTRIVSEPLSEYMRFEYDISFTNAAAGEEIRWLPRRRASGLALPGNDCWIFDRRLVLWNHFTGEGDVSPAGRELTDDPEMVKLCAAAFEGAWERAIPHQQYRPA
jgi:Family of unknown function (DUF6879)